MPASVKAVGETGENMKKLTLISIIFLALTALVLQIANIYIYNREALNSVDATKIQAKLESLKENNIEIESKLLAFASYGAIASRAGELGYIDNKEFVSLYDPVQVAIGR